MSTPVYVSLFLLVCITCNTTCLAGNGHSSPTNFSTTGFMATVKNFDAMNTNTGTAKVCACQILNLRSNNHHLENVAVFAERTNNDANNDFELAIKRLEKEKLHLRLLFFDKISVVTKTRAATDCNSLFIQLKKKHDRLVTYEV